jgi:hypothetical protein
MPIVGYRTHLKGFDQIVLAMQKDSPLVRAHIDVTRICIRTFTSRSLRGITSGRTSRQDEICYDKGRLVSIERTINLVDCLLHLRRCAWPPINEEKLAISPDPSSTGSELGDQSFHTYLSARNIKQGARRGSKKQHTGYGPRLLLGAAKLPSPELPQTTDVDQQDSRAVLGPRVRRRRHELTWRRLYGAAQSSF